MPRKQRFKPSRKPKPSPQSEAATIGNDARNPSSHSPGIDVDADNDNVTASPSHPHDDDSLHEPDNDASSR
jgi:hypothetical protein